MTTMDAILATINPGSSTIKLGVFGVESDAVRPRRKGVIDLRRQPLTLRIAGEPDAIPLHSSNTEDLRELIEAVLGWIGTDFPGSRLTGVGHRVVHGGDRFAGPELINGDTFRAIESLVPLAPLHQPQSVRLIKAIRDQRPELPQVASFDTAFHRSQSEVVRRFALPRSLFDEGVKHYGFHGLSYKFIAAQLAKVAPDVAGRRVVVAHLGSGASLCALDGGRSRDTSMSFSTLDGIPMATRCGALDPGVLLYLVKERGMEIDAVADMLYHRSGLLGISGVSGDSRDLLGSAAPEAKQAIDVWTFRIAREMAALTTSLGGLDGIVFTAGVGEHQPEIRSAVCRHLAWLGVTLDDQANGSNRLRIEAAGSKVAVLVIPTDEEEVIAEEAHSVLMSRPN